MRSENLELSALVRVTGASCKEVGDENRGLRSVSINVPVYTPPPGRPQGFAQDVCHNLAALRARACVGSVGDYDRPAEA
jgi:hypothetical protein